MKKLISIMVVLSLIASCFTFGVAHASSEIVGENEFAQLSALGFMVGDDTGNPRLSDNMTRAEFAQVIKNLLTYANGGDDNISSAWAQNFYGENTDYNELKEPSDTDAPVRYFNDVPVSHWAYDTITYIREMGIMSGTSDTTFSPDSEVNTNQVIKTLMVLLGYRTVAENSGGYPDGYMMHAKRIKLLNGINPGKHITRGEIAVLIINCMDANVLSLSGMQQGESYDFVKDDTFASMFLGLEKHSGLMTDNGISSLIAESRYDGKYIVVDDVILKIAEDYDCSAFLGREVDVWYKNSSTDEPELAVCVCLSGTDTFVEIESGNIEKASLDEIYYRNKDGNLKKESISDAYIIYNGMAINSYTDDIFDIISGNIQICKTNSEKYDKIVYVNEPETWYVSNVDTENTVIYNALKSGKTIAESDILRLDFEDPSYKITIYNEDGSLSSFAGITKGSVLDVVRSGRVVKIYITQKTVTDFKVSQIYEDYRGIVISDGSNEFALTKAYENYYSRDEIRAGDILSLYLNREDRVAWAASQSKSDLNIGYIIRAGEDSTSGFESTYAVKIYDLKGVIDTPVIAEKITVSDSYGKVSRITAENYYKAYKNYAGICRYSINDDDEVSYVEFPISDRDTSINGKLHLVMETTEETKSTDGYFVHSSLNTFGAKALINSSTKVLCYNPNASDEDDAFSMATSSIFGEKSNNVVKLYTDVQGSPVGKYVIYETASVASDLGNLSEGFIVKKVVQGMHPDENAGDVIKAVRFKFNDAVRDEDLYLKEGVIDNIEVEAQDHAKWNGTLEPGDIIRVEKDSDGMVNKVRIIWDENGTDDGGVTPGSLPGMSEYFHTSNYNTNPWAISWNADLSLYDASGFSAGILRVYNGFPYNVRDGAMRLTTYDMPAKGYDNVDENKYINEVWNIVRVVTVDLTKYGKVTVSKGTSADIKSYEEFGPDCSRIVSFSRAGTIDTFVVINGYFEG